MPSIAQDGVRVQGLADLQRELRKVSIELPLELKAANLMVAELVAKRASSRASSVGGVAAKVASSIKAAGQQRYAIVRWGGSGLPFAGGAEFGARHDIPRPVSRQGSRYTMLGWNQFRNWIGDHARGALIEFDEPASGYFIQPSISDERAEIIETYDRLIQQIAAKAFPD